MDFLEQTRLLKRIRVPVAIVIIGLALSGLTAFAHLTLAVLFIGVLKDPVRNLWVLTFGLIACVSVLPLAMICGAVRGIPIYWQLIDSSFGFLGFIPLWLARRDVLKLEAAAGTK